MRTRLSKLKRLWRHYWESEVHRILTPELLERLTRHVGTSERRHSGEIRICIEAALPPSYIWRGASTRERAIAMFSKLRVWDTEDNNGVLIYLLLAEHAIEIVADRGINRHVPDEEWTGMVRHMGATFREGRFEEGLTHTLEAVSARLVQHFPLAPGAPDTNELPDAPVII